MLASSAAPTIAENALRELRRLLLEPKLGAALPKSGIDADSELYKDTKNKALDWKTYTWLQRSVWLENILLHRPKRWLPEKYPNYDELLTAAVEAAIDDPQAPKDLASWRWGAFNALDIQHPILGKIPIVSHWSGPGVREQSGSGYAVKAVTPVHGPSERFTANMADLDQSTLNTVTGQGGNFLSPYYMDQWKAWYGGTTFTLPFSAKAVDTTKTHQLTIEPDKP
jgi:penicillin amidase